MTKAAAIEEMYMMYQASRKYLVGLGNHSTDFVWAELEAAFLSFCQREPIGGMFLESVLEELMDRADDQAIGGVAGQAAHGDAISWN